ncbi:MAG: peptidylprolyl isomerase [Oscillospiraceae bacterium]|jgi:cyclophilin family peptidyl-prolyl cis-trans isomerase|nr:peptidylprolyl isomerase [Oscillospiraceae bacterium]
MNKNSKKLIGVLLMCFTILSFCGCQNKHNPSDDDNPIGYQLNLPEKDEEIAVVNTNLGSFKIRFFPKAAPKSVENFKKLSQNGYYNGIIFHRVIKNFMVQTGDPNGNGTGGQSIWGKDFEDEFSSKLFNITGSVSMANRGPNTNGSQFFINNKDSSSFEGWERYQKTYDIYKQDPGKFSSKYGTTIDMSKITDEIKNLYEKHGGNPNLDGYYSTANKGHTVFGQVFEGMETINSISQSPTNDSDKPLDEIRINNIEIVAYS